MKLAVFHVTATFVPGGSEGYAWRLARFLHDRDHTVHLWAGELAVPRVLDPHVELRTARFTPRERVPRLGSRFQKLGERLTFAWHARQRVLAERYDLLNLHKPYDIPAALWFRRRTGCKIVWRCHGTDFYPGLGALIHRLDAIWCVSEFTRATLQKAYPVAADVIHTGVDAGFFNPVHAEPGPPGEVPRLLYFGRLEGWKGVAYFVEALARLRDEAWTATIVGDGPEEPRLEAQVKHLALQERVTLQPAVAGAPAVRRLLAEADIAVFPPVGVETFSNALLEALSMAKAVVATRVGGNVEAVEDDVNGLLVAPANAEDLAAGLRRLLHDPTLRQRLGTQGRESVRLRFNARDSFLAVETLFARVLGQPTARTASAHGATVPRPSQSKSP